MLMLRRATSDERRATLIRCLTFLVLVLALAGHASAADGPPPAIHAASGLQEAALFYAFALMTVVSALGVALSRSVVRMATWLFFTFGAVALLFFLLQAHFLAAVQLIVYVAGVLVLIVFGIMLTASSPWLRFEVKRGELLVSGVICAGLCAVIGHAIWRTNWPTSRAASTNIGIDALGRTLLTDYLVPFELAAVLLMVILIGAAYLARQPQR
jgi:NADH:ubiquinone oxidoreductase subunit 6 (subunit J)